MKKSMKMSIFTVLLTITSINVHLAQKPVALSEIAMANVEALTESESSKGVQKVTFTELGEKSYPCIDGYTYEVFWYKCECEGEGSFPCNEGIYEHRVQTTTPCYTALI